MSAASLRALNVAERKSSWSQNYVRRLSRHQNPQDPLNVPLLGQVVSDEGNIKRLESGNDAFYGFRADLQASEVVRLIGTIQDDDAEKFCTFKFEQIEGILMNVVLTELPAHNYLSKSFWQILNGIGLLHIACLLSAHSILDILLRRKVSFSMTDEGVTPVHVCAALGDYIGLRKLLVADFPFLTQDRADKVPVMFCQYHDHQAIKEYIIKLIHAQNLLRLTESEEKDGECLGTNAYWKLPLNFDSYLCTKVRPMHCYNGRTYCECSDDCAHHEKFSENEALNEVIQSRKELFIKRPTNTFGQFETPCSNVMAEFVRIADDTNADRFSLLFFDIWKLKQPELVLTLYGSVPPKKSRQKRFYNMVIGVVQKTLTWIITDGIYGSVAEVISDGMRGYAEAYGLTQLQVIGLAPWRHLSSQADLHSSDYSGCYQAKFPEMDKRTTTQAQLAPFHTRYLFVDCGSRNDHQCIQDFRNRFEVWLANISLEVESFELSRNVPICGVLITGRPEDALGVYEALSHGIPFVVFGDSGGLASILEQCVVEKEYLQEGGAIYTDATLEDIEIAENKSRERLVEIIAQFWTEEEISPESLGTVMRILSYSDIIEFFSYERDTGSSLEAKIVSSLINPVLFQSHDSKSYWESRLKIALDLDRSDFVTEKILNDARWTPKEMTPFVKSCLLKNKVHFLRIFTDAGFDMHQFATTRVVEELYTAEAQRNTIGAITLKQFLIYYQTKLPTRITIERVKKTLQKIMSHHFLTYSSENSKISTIRRPTFKSIHGDLEDGPRKSRDTFVKAGKGSCLQYLYLWALITRRFDIAQFLLMMQSDISAGALFAAAFIRRLSKVIRQTSDNEEFRLRAREFELLAVSILDACFFNNKENTMLLLVMERRSFGMLSCMMIASEGNCREFMQHRACQEYLDRVWAHTLQIKKFSFRLLFSLVIGIICPPAVPFVAEYDESKYDKLPNSRDVAISNWMSFQIFISEPFHRIIFITSSAYIIGTIVQLLIYFVYPRTYLLEQFSQICLAIAMFFPFTKILRLLSIGKYVGPKLQMIKKMSERDLGPYSVIICLFWLLYSVIFSSIIIRPSSDPRKASSSLFYVVKSSFFQMFGDFQAADFIDYYASRVCITSAESGCTYPGYYTTIPILMAMFTLMNYVLLITLLIAIFTKTYDRMEKFSQQLWTMQRYRIIEYLLAESVQPGPFLIYSFAHQLIMLMIRPEVNRGFQKQQAFCKSFADNPGSERQLINWEKLNALAVMGTLVEEHELKRSSDSSYDNTRKQIESWKTSAEQCLQTIHKSMPPSIIFQNFAKSVDALEKRIGSIDAKLEKIANIISDQPLDSRLRSPSGFTRNDSLKPSRGEMYGSITNNKGIEDAPIVLQWLNHQIAIFASMTSDATPHSVNPPVPWELPYSNYHAIPWKPRKSTTVRWLVSEHPPTRASLRKNSVESFSFDFYDTAPKNPEGRVGTAGKGLLPEVGENAACVLVVTRGVNNEEIFVLKGVHKQAQFPWFLCYHPHSCSQTTCFRGLVRFFCLSRVNSGNEAIDKAVADDFVAHFVRDIKIGAVSDPINCDNAWIVVTSIHIQIPQDYRLIEGVEKMLLIKECSASWVSREELPTLRESHLKAMGAVV
ncbi:hypothetical protein Aperf_G00000093241 [Anoplocephala perfoliata]